MRPLAMTHPVRHRTRSEKLCLGLLGVLLVAGCSSEKESDKSSGGDFQYGSLLEPFEPPPFEELISAHEWIDRPVVDAMQRLRDEQSGLGQPALSVDAALALKNNSKEENAQIIDALGRLAPPDGEGVDFEAEAVLIAHADLKSTNPLLTSSVVESDYHGLTVFGIFSFDRYFNKFAVAEYVESWQSSEDRMIDKIVLRDDMYWSDGTPITAHDIAFSFRVLMSEEVPIPALRQGTDLIKWAEAYDDKTVVFFHREALATNDANMNFYVIPKHVYESTIPEDPTMARSDAHSKLEDAPVVGGPYELVKRIRGQEFVLERREEYYMQDGVQVREMPYFKRIRFKVIEDRNTALLALMSGRVDSMELLSEHWLGQTAEDEFYVHNTRASGVEWSNLICCWNTKTPYFEDKRVRKAMSYAVDYEELIGTVLYGLYEPCRGTFHPESRMFPEDGPEPFEQDFEAAEALLDEAGWIDEDGDGVRERVINGKTVPFRFTLQVTNQDERVKMATLIKENLDQIGVECIVKPLEFTVMFELQRQRKFQAAIFGWSTGADPDTTENIFGSGQMRNFGDYSNPEVDRLFLEAKREFDLDKQSKLYGEIHSILWEDQPYTWLCNKNSYYGFNKRLRGYNFSPRGPFHFGPGISSLYKPVAQP